MGSNYIFNLYGWSLDSVLTKLNIMIDVKDLIPMITDNEFELIVPDHVLLHTDDLKYMNEHGYLYLEELLEVEFEDKEGNVIDYQNIYYFKKVLDV